MPGRYVARAELGPRNDARSTACGSGSRHSLEVIDEGPQRRGNVPSAGIIEVGAGKRRPPIRDNGLQMSGSDIRVEQFLETRNNAQPGQRRADLDLDLRGDDRRPWIKADCLAIALQFPVIDRASESDGECRNAASDRGDAWASARIEIGGGAWPSRSAERAGRSARRSCSAPAARRSGYRRLIPPRLRR